MILIELVSEKVPGTSTTMIQPLKRWLARCLAALGCLLLVVTLTPVADWYAVILAGPWRDSKGDVLIVLAGADHGEGVIGLNSYWRTLYAARAYRAGEFRRILISGGGANPPIAESMRNAITTMGVPRESVLTETQSTTTRENALYTKPLARSLPGKKVLMTSDYHMFRAFRVFRKAGIDVEPRPIPDARKRATSVIGRWGVFLDLVSESAKIVGYKVKGWI